MGRHTGTFGLVGAMSFNGNKTISTGGGGMLLFNDTRLAAKAKHLSTPANSAHVWEFVHDSAASTTDQHQLALGGVPQIENRLTDIADKTRTAQPTRFSPATAKESAS